MQQFSYLFAPSTLAQPSVSSRCLASLLGLTSHACVVPGEGAAMGSKR